MYRFTSYKMELNTIQVAAIAPIQAADHFREESRIDHYDEEQTAPSMPAVEMTAAIAFPLSSLSFFFSCASALLLKELDCPPGESESLLSISHPQQLRRHMVNFKASWMGFNFHLA